MDFSKFIDGLTSSLRRMFAIPDFSQGIIPDFLGGTSIRNSVFVAFLLIILFIFIGLKVKKSNPLKKPNKISKKYSIKYYTKKEAQPTMGLRLF